MAGASHPVSPPGQPSGPPGPEGTEGPDPGQEGSNKRIPHPVDRPRPPDQDPLVDDGKHVEPTPYLR